MEGGEVEFTIKEERQDTVADGSVNPTATGEGEEEITET